MNGFLRLRYFLDVCMGVHGALAASRLRKFHLASSSHGTFRYKQLVLFYVFITCFVPLPQSEKNENIDVLTPILLMDVFSLPCSNASSIHGAFTSGLINIVQSNACRQSAPISIGFRSNHGKFPIRIGQDSW